MRCVPKVSKSRRGRDGLCPVSGYRGCASVRPRRGFLEGAMSGGRQMRGHGRRVGAATGEKSQAGPPGEAPRPVPPLRPGGLLGYRWPPAQMTIMGLESHHASDRASRDRNGGSRHGTETVEALRAAEILTTRRRPLPPRAKMLRGTGSRPPGTRVPASILMRGVSVCFEIVGVGVGSDSSHGLDPHAAVTWARASTVTLAQSLATEVRRQ
jgi:hypothetical protein